MQINNLKIKFNSSQNLWVVITPDKRILEEFNSVDSAISFARSTKDFLAKRPTEDKGQPGICKLCGHNLDDSWVANDIDTDADMYVRKYRCKHCGAIGEERHSLCFEENTARRLLQLAS